MGESPKRAIQNAPVYNKHLLLHTLKGPAQDCFHAYIEPGGGRCFTSPRYGVGSGYTSAAMGVLPSASSPMLLRNTSDVKGTVKRILLS